MKSNSNKFFVLFSLYIAQSIPMSFFSSIMPVIMRQENFSLESIGLIQLVKLPWIIKFLWAPFIDRYTVTTKDFRRWIFGSEIFYALVIFSIGFLSLDLNFTLIIILIIIAFIASATQDIATDAYAILLLKAEERGFGNSMQTGGSFIGTLFGSGVLLIVYHHFGWQALLSALAIFVLIALIPLYFFKKQGKVEKIEEIKTSPKDIITFFQQPGIYRHILILAFFNSGIIGILAMLKPYLVDFGYETDEIGFMAGIVGTSIAAGTSLLAGWVVKRKTRHKVLFLFLFVNLLAGVYFYALSIWGGSIHSIYGGITVIWGAYGLSSVVIYTSAMDKVRPGREGTDFTLQIVILHLSSLIITILSGRIADQFEYSGLYVAEICLSLIAIIILFFVKPKTLNYGKPIRINK
jgi:predicted MFS family arabinose efflux permease